MSVFEKVLVGIEYQKNSTIASAHATGCMTTALQGMYNANEALERENKRLSDKLEHARMCFTRERDCLDSLKKFLLSTKHGGATLSRFFNAKKEDKK